MNDDDSDGDLVIGTLSRVFVTIKPDGSLLYGEGYTPDEAAAVFWEALARKRVEAEESAGVRFATTIEKAGLGMEERFNEWERALITLAKADAANEIAQTQRNRLVGSIPGSAPQMRRADARAAQTESYLNECAVAMIVLARAHAVRTGALHEIDADVLPAVEPPDPKMAN